MSAPSVAQRHGAGDAWLASCAMDPDLVRETWDADQLAPIASGAHWLVAESTIVHGLPAASRIREDQRGPVLMSPYEDRAWWLLPLGSANELADVRQLWLWPAGWALRCPPVGRELARVHWLWAPDGTGHLTDPAVLAAALGPGGYRPIPEAS